MLDFPAWLNTERCRDQTREGTSSVLQRWLVGLLIGALLVVGLCGIAMTSISTARCCASL